MSARLAVALGLLLAGMGLGLPVWATVACTLSTASVQGVYEASQDLDLSGTVSLQCTRSLSDSSTFAYTLTLDAGLTTGTRELYAHGGSGTDSSRRLTHDVSMSAYGGLSWTTTVNNVVTGSLNFGAGTTASASHTYYLRVPQGQIAKSPGIYDDILVFRLLAGDVTAAPIATGSITPTVSLPSACFVGQLGSGAFAAQNTLSPTTLALHYTSFSPWPVSSTMQFTIGCTLGTPYSVSLSPASGTLLGLPYQLSLSSSSGTGTGYAQNFVVTGTVNAGLAGQCAQASCQATQSTTITVSY